MSLYSDGEETKVEEGEGNTKPRVRSAPDGSDKHDSGPNRPSPATYVTQDGSKIWLFLGQNQAFMAGPGSKGVHITWKVSGVLVQIHGKTCLRTIHHLLMHPFGADGSKIWLFLCGLCYRRLLISQPY